MRGECLKVPSFHVAEGCLTIVLPEELDHPISDRIRKETERVMQEYYIRRICLDFKNTTFMDSSGIGMIMGRYRALGMQKGCLEAVHVNARMERLLRLSGVLKYLKILE